MIWVRIPLGDWQRGCRLEGQSRGGGEVLKGEGTGLHVYCKLETANDVLL